LHQRIEEIAAGHRGGPLDDRAERLFDLAAVSRFHLNFTMQGANGLVRFHVLDRQADLVRCLLEQKRV